MKPIVTRLSRQYALALASHLRQGSRRAPPNALALGRKAVVLRLETLDLARMHEQAILKLAMTNAPTHVLKNAQRFFTEAIAPIIETHRAARESKLTLKRLNEMLLRASADLALANRNLRQGVFRRLKVEAALKKTGADYSKLLRESKRLAGGFRHLTHRVLAAQEDERKKISHELQDQVAQTLLGVNVRLLTLKGESKSGIQDLKKEIVSTQRLVARSVKSVRLVATRLGKA